MWMSKDIGPQAHWSLLAAKNDLKETLLPSIYSLYPYAVWPRIGNKLLQASELTEICETNAPNSTGKVVSGIEKNRATPHQSVAYKPLGALRFGLAFLVFLHHSLPLTASRTYQPSHIINVGHMGVMVFYALSGFVISEAVYTFYRERPFSFIANRILKLWPPYLAALALALLVNLYASHSGMWPHDPEFLTYQKASPELLSAGTLTYNVLYTFPIVVSSLLSAFDAFSVGHMNYMFLRVAPTLQVEWVFYYVMFVASLLTFKLARGAGLAILVGALAMYLVSEKTIWSYTPLFLIGVGFASVHRLKLGEIFSILIILLLYILAGMQFWQFFGSQYLWEWKIVNMLGFLAFLAVIHILSRRSVDGPIKKIDQWFGNLSYPFYLNHSVVLFLAAAMSPARDGVFWCMTFFAAFMTSWAMMVLIEKPLIIIRDRVRGRKL